MRPRPVFRSLQVTPQALQPLHRCLDALLSSVGVSSGHISQDAGHTGAAAVPSAATTSPGGVMEDVASCIVEAVAAWAVVSPLAATAVASVGDVFSYSCCSASALGQLHSVWDADVVVAALGDRLGAVLALAAASARSSDGSDTSDATLARVAAACIAAATQPLRVEWTTRCTDMHAIAVSALRHVLVRVVLRHCGTAAIAPLLAAAASRVTGGCGGVIGAGDAAAAAGTLAFVDAACVAYPTAVAACAAALLGGADGNGDSDSDSAAALAAALAALCCSVPSCAAACRGPMLSLLHPDRAEALLSLPRAATAAVAVTAAAATAATAVSTTAAPAPSPSPSQSPHRGGGASHRKRKAVGDVVGASSGVAMSDSLAAAHPLVTGLHPALLQCLLQCVGVDDAAVLDAVCDVAACGSSSVAAVCDLAACLRAALPTCGAVLVSLNRSLRRLIDVAVHDIAADPAHSTTGFCVQMLVATVARGGTTVLLKVRCRASACVGSHRMCKRVWDQCVVSCGQSRQSHVCVHFVCVCVCVCVCVYVRTCVCMCVAPGDYDAGGRRCRVALR
jgi:hypothetical protein